MHEALLAGLPRRQRLQDQGQRQGEQRLQLALGGAQLRVQGLQHEQCQGRGCDCDVKVALSCVQMQLAWPAAGARNQTICFRAQRLQLV